MKHERPFRAELVLQMLYFDPKYLAIEQDFDFGFDRDGLFFQMSENPFNVENNKCIYERYFILYHVTGSTYSRITIGAYTQGYIKKLWKKLERFNLYQS